MTDVIAPADDWHAMCYSFSDRSDRGFRRSQPVGFFGTNAVFTEANLLSPTLVEALIEIEETIQAIQPALRFAAL